jgi:lipoic acid synthetase
VIRYWTPDEFAALEDLGNRLGFQHVASGPLVRSSYHADQMAHAAGYVNVDAADLERPGSAPVTAAPR